MATMIPSAISAALSADLTYNFPDAADPFKPLLAI